MDILIGHDPLIYVKGQSYASRKIIPRAIYKFSTRSDEFSKENLICGRTAKTGLGQFLKPASDGFYWPPQRSRRNQVSFPWETRI